MVYHADLPTQIEDALSQWDCALAEILRDGTVDSSEAARLNNMRSEIRATLPIAGEMRITYRIVRRALNCGYRNLIDKHVRAEIEDHERRTQVLAVASTRKSPHAGRANGRGKEAA